MITKFLLALAGSFLVVPSHAFSSDGEAPQAKPGLYGSSKNLKCPLEVKPSQGFGPLELGQGIEADQLAGLEIKKVRGSKTSFIAGRFHLVVNDQNRVTSIEAELGDLPNCVQFGKQKIKKTVSTSQLSKLFKNCGKETALEGGNVITCEGIEIHTGGWGGQQKTPALKVVSMSRR